MLTLAELAAIECIKCPFFENIDDVDDSVDLDDAMTSRQMAIRLMAACQKMTFFTLMKGTLCLIAFHVGQGLIPSMSK